MSTGVHSRVMRRVALIAALAAVAHGCAAPRNHLHREKSASFERALVLPLNLVVSMPHELAGGAIRVEKELLGYLAERGKAVETMRFADARAAWDAGVRACRAEGHKGCDRFKGAARDVARSLRRDHDYDVLIIPYLMFRSARSGSETAAWDGVKRPVETSGPGFGPEGPFQLARGRIRAASLRVFAFSGDGDEVFRGVGGLDLVDRVQATRDDLDYTIEVREELLRDPAAIHEGVALALDPLMPRIREKHR